MKKLIPKNSRPVSIINIENGQVYTYSSMSEAGQALNNEFRIVNSGNTGRNIICNRLTGHTKKSSL